MQRADSEQGYSFARLTMRALFWKHFLIKCYETGEEKRNTDEAEIPVVTGTKKNYRQVFQNIDLMSNKHFSDNSGQVNK